jgi:hypothetical protein
MKMAQSQQSLSQQQEQLQQHQLQQVVLMFLIFPPSFPFSNDQSSHIINILYLLCYQSNRKRKQASSSGAANSTGTGNTAGPSPNSPSSTHTPGDGLNTSSSMQHVNNVQKSMMMYGAEATGGLGSSSNLLVSFINKFSLS